MRHMGKWRKRAFALVAGATLLAACSSGGSEDPSAEDGGTAQEGAGGDATADQLPENPDEGFTTDTIRLGWMGDATGPTASAQGLNLRGVESWVEHTNSEGGILGRQVELVVKDDQFVAENAISNFRSLVDDDRVLGLVGFGGAHISEALMGDVENAQIPIVGPQQTIDAQIANPYVFNNLAHFGDEADVAVARLADRADMDVADLRVVVISLEIPSGDEWLAYIRDSLEKQGGGAYVDRITMPADSVDFATMVTQLREFQEEEGMNAIAFHGAPAAGLGLLTEMVRQELTDVPVLGIHGLAGQTVYTEAPPGSQDIVEGVHSFTPCNVDTEGTQAIQAAVEGSEGAEDCRHLNFSHGWVNSMVIAEAIERAAEEAGEVSRETVTEALRGTFDTKGLTCPIDWSDSQHSPCAAPFSWDEDQEGLVIADDSYEAWEDVIDQSYNVEVGG